MMLFWNKLGKPICTKGFKLKLLPNQLKISERSPKSLKLPTKKPSEGQDRNDMNPPTFSIRFLHTICRPLQITAIH